MPRTGASGAARMLHRRGDRVKIDLMMLGPCGIYCGSCTTLHGFYGGGDYESAKRTLERIREVGLSQQVAEKEEELAV